MTKKDEEMSQSELDTAMASYQNASKAHRDAWERLDRARRDFIRAEEVDKEVRVALKEARKRLDVALDADGVAEETK